MHNKHFHKPDSETKTLNLIKPRLNLGRITTVQNTLAPLYESKHEGHIHLRGISDARAQNLCHICHSSNLKVFFEISDVPICCNTPWPSREEAQNCPKGNIKLGFCPICSFITNLDFKPSSLKYTRAYGNPLHFSLYFQDYAQSLAEQLIKKYNLYNKDIIEIGCGDGYFLKLLCKLGNNRGVGFDPAYVQSKKTSSNKEQVKFIQDYYSERYIDYQGDLIVCRQTLEHIPDPIKFLKMLRKIIGNREHTKIFFEVPNSTQIFRNLFIWDIIYEHCSYFTSPALARTFSTSSFHVTELIENFENQFLLLHARPRDQSTPHPNTKYLNEINKIAKDIESFPANYQNKVENYRQKLKKIIDRGQRVVIWGAGSKGVTFLNILKEIPIEYVVDINPRKQGMHVPCTGQKIVPPEFLQEYQPDLVFVMNPIYKQEVQQITDKLGLTTKLISI